MSFEVTGIGSLPGVDFRGALKFTLEQSQPWLPELPDRGAGAAMLGRSVSWLPFPWHDKQAGLDFWERDFDILEELAHDYTGPFKVALAGPWTLVSGLELPRGQKVLSDAGAVRDFCDGFSVGVLELLARLRSVMPAADVMVQVDEPMLPAVLAGNIPTAGGLLRYQAVDQQQVARQLATLVQSLSGNAAGIVLHSCAALELEMFLSCGLTGIATPGRFNSADVWLQVAETGLRCYYGIDVLAADHLPHPSDVCHAIITKFQPDVVPSLVLTPECGTPQVTASGVVKIMRFLSDVAGELEAELGDLR